ncbi:MAG: hypothetical protein V3S82_05065, partial [Dehalococcoidia bacterium]
VIPEASVERLQAMGRWMAINGESIYGTQASPFAQPQWGRYTTKPGRLYAHVFDWPVDGRLEIPVLERPYREAQLLTAEGPRTLELATTALGAVLTLPGDSPDPTAAVIALSY